MKATIVCKRCILNSDIVPDIQFDSNGVCNHCLRYDSLLQSRVQRGAAGKQALDELVNRVKSSGIGCEYDCIIGVSGGVDSTYVAYLVKQLGLRPLAVHLDNGWDSELAVKNIEKTLKKLDIELFTYVIDWEEFRDLQVAFLKASTPDGEIPSDHAISAVLWQQASKRGIRYIVSGMNFATESFSNPDWAYGHSDWEYIKNVHSIFGKRQLESFPHFSLFDLFFYNVVKRIRIISVLNYIDYKKEDAMQVLKKELDWEYYGGKHFESTYTRFYQSFFLPQKFGIDKRYGHLSDLINSGQISREEALQEIGKPACPVEVAKSDIAYAIKKLGLSQAEFETILNDSPKSFRDYRNSFSKVELLKKMVNFLRRNGLYPK